MRARIRHVGTDVVVELDGDADLAAAPTLSHALARAVAQAPDHATDLVIDLDGLSVLDDTALGLVVGAAAGARRAGLDVALVCTNRRLRDRLANTRIDQIVDIRTTPAP